MSAGSVAYKKYIKQWQITEIFWITEVSDWRDFLVTALLDCTIVILYRLSELISGVTGHMCNTYSTSLKIAFPYSHSYT